MGWDGPLPLGSCCPRTDRGQVLSASVASWVGTWGSKSQRWELSLVLAWGGWVSAVSVAPQRKGGGS